MRYFRYARYVAAHKWFVFLAACRLGVPWLGLLHDLSKFRPSEFFPYATFFYGPKAKQVRDSTGYYSPHAAESPGKVAFQAAWFLHQRRNKHHWQWWVEVKDDGALLMRPIPERYMKEMIADWIGAGRAQGTPDTLGWYRANKGKLWLHPESRTWIEAQIGYTP